MEIPEAFQRKRHRIYTVLYFCHYTICKRLRARRLWFICMIRQKEVKYCLGAASLWWLPKLARKRISQTDRVTCVSRRQAEIIADQAPELKDKVEIVCNLLPLEIINTEKISRRYTHVSHWQYTEALYWAAPNSASGNDTLEHQH
jgi:hypothetical protein